MVGGGEVLAASALFDEALEVGAHGGFVFAVRDELVVYLSKDPLDSGRIVDQEVARA